MTGSLKLFWLKCLIPLVISRYNRMPKWSMLALVWERINNFRSAEVWSADDSPSDGNWSLDGTCEGESGLFTLHPGHSLVQKPSQSHFDTWMLSHLPVESDMKAYFHTFPSTVSSVENRQLETHQSDMAGTVCVQCDKEEQNFSLSIDLVRAREPNEGTACADPAR